MSDIFTRTKRSDIMRRVKSSNNRSTELRLIEIFKANNIKGWRRNCKISGKPDFIFNRKKIAVFIDGCFWHGHSCRNITPKQNENYWKTKLYRNKKRDREVTQYLKNLNWQVVRVWECELQKKHFHKLLRKLKLFL
jgi:DNA mismatch endonuclease (patch repair protein)